MGCCKEWFALTAWHRASGGARASPPHMCTAFGTADGKLIVAQAVLLRRPSPPATWWLAAQEPQRASWRVLFLNSCPRSAPAVGLQRLAVIN